MNRPGSSISKSITKKNTSGVQIPVAKKQTQGATLPKYEDKIKERDWVAAICLLEDQKRVTDTKGDILGWLAYCYFHSGEYGKAISTYDDLMAKKPDYNKELHVYKACCHYALCNYDEAKRECAKAMETPLFVRLMFHISHKKDDENSLMTYHHKLMESTEDQLALAAIHYLRGHFEEAVDIYKKLLIENREYLAINVYIALCYYKMDYYDVSLEILSAYIAQNPKSIIAVNLKACNQYQVYNGKQAELEFKSLQPYEGVIENDFDLIRHNLVVFKNGEDALKVLPPLIDVFPEARLNLVIYHLKNDDVAEALKFIKDHQPTTPREYIIKGVVHAVYGQKHNLKEHLNQAQHLFQLVGASASECDTIPGRQAMASCFFLLKQFDDVLVYLKSIRNFFQNDDDFNWNFAIASASAGEYKDAEEAFLLIQNEKAKAEYCYISWLTKTFIMNGKPSLAWELHMNMEASNESLHLLQLIGNDCYKMGHFYYAAKAFDILERMEIGEFDITEGKLGACVGVFQKVIADQEPKEHLEEIAAMLKNTNNPQTEYILKVMKKWAKDNGVKMS